MKKYITIREEKISVNGEITFRTVEVPLSEKEFGEIAGMTDGFRRRMQRRGQCCCPAGCRLYCQCDCFTCAFAVKTAARSLDEELFEDEGGSATLADFVPDPGLSPQELLEKRELHEALMAALDGLNAGEREVIELSLAGLSGAEIAGRLGVTGSRVSQKYVSALKKLREILKDFS